MPLFAAVTNRQSQIFAKQYLHIRASINESSLDQYFTEPDSVDYECCRGGPICVSLLIGAWYECNVLQNCSDCGNLNLFVLVNAINKFLI